MLLEDPQVDTYAREVAQATGLPSGEVQPILVRFVDAGWLEAEWETGDPHVLGRPLRRYLRFADGGVDAARAALSRAGG